MYDNLLFNPIIYGGLSGAISKSCVTPLDQYKIIYQLHGKGIRRNHPNLRLGWRLWKGNSAIIGRTFIYSGIQLSTNKYMIEQGYSKSIASLVTSLSAITFTYPIDIIRTNLANDHGNKGIRDFARSIYTNRMMYKGILFAYGSTIPFNFSNFYIYATLNEFPCGTGKFKPWLAASISTAISCALFFPLDTIKQNIQNIQNKDKKNMEIVRNLIINENGFRRLYAGFVFNLIKSVAYNAMRFQLFNLCFIREKNS